jgi:eukaryotic-like serine/threonine-protein kinase
MQASRARANPVRFGAFEADVEAGELRKNGLKVPLQEQPFRVLTLLLENPGKVVTREELQQRLWAADTFVEFDRGLNTAINKVREALDDSATSPRFVETVPRRGYRFVAPVGGNEPKPVRRHVNVWVRVAVLVALVAGGLGSAIVWRQFGRSTRTTEAPLRKFSITPLGRIGLHQFDCPFMELAISPDGKHVAYIAQDNSSDRQSLYLYEFERGRSREMEGTDGATFPFWSPGSDFVGFSVGGSVEKLPVQGGVPTRLTTLPGGFARAVWSLDSAEIALTDGQRLYCMPSIGGKATSLLQPLDNVLAIYPQFLPSRSSHRLLAFTSRQVPSGREEVDLLDGNRPPRVLIGPEASAEVYHWLSYSPQGYLMYERVSNNKSAVWALPLSADSLSATGDPFPIVENAEYPSVSQEGTLVYRPVATPPKKHLVWVDRTGKMVSEIGEPQLDMYLPKLSPDGKYVAVEGVVEPTSASDIWIHDTFRPSMTRLTLDPARDSRPFWSSDGTQILFWSLRTGKVEAFIQKADGTGKAEKVLSDYPSDWSHSGDYLLFDGDWFLHKSGSGTWERDKTPYKGYSGTLSPDGRFVAYTTAESGRWTVEVQSFPEPNQRWHISTGGGLEPRR